jgi:hypothetical protein
MHVMRRSSHASIVALACAAVLALAAGCQKKTEAPPPTVETPKPVAFRVTGIELGKALTADKKIASPAGTFGKKDTIYVAVSSEGASSSTRLIAHWTFEDGQTVAADSQAIAPTGPAQTEFHILSPSPWPAGKYTVEVFVDSLSAGRKEFTVQ